LAHIDFSDEVEQSGLLDPPLALFRLGKLKSLRELEVEFLREISVIECNANHLLFLRSA